MADTDTNERGGLLALARSAYNERRWTDAYDAFSEADGAEPLGASDLELIATSSFMLGKVPEMLATQERAHDAYLTEGDDLRAARAALWLATNLASRGKIPQASGWVGVSERLLQSAPQDCVERGYLLMPQALRRVASGEFEEVATLSARAADIGRRFDDPDLTALAAQTQGRALLRLSKTAEGLRLLDEVMVSATSARMNPMVTGIVYCSVLEGCFETHAISRAATWTRSLTDWCGEQPDLVAFTDQCFAHRSEILRLQGAWTQAVEEAGRARQAGARFRIAAQATYQIAEIHRMRGDLDTALEAYRQGSVDGGDPMPGLALVRLAQGNHDAAFASIMDAVTEAADPLTRIGLFPTVVEVAIATDHLPEASQAAKELTESARHTQTEVHIAWASHAEGRVALAEQRNTQAVTHLRTAKQQWQDLALPYELARTRVDLARALLTREDEEGAGLESAAARAVFVELGAIPDVRTLDGLMHRARLEWPCGLTDREVEVLRMLASGATNRAIASSLVLSERTVDRHVSNIFTKIEVSSRSAATAWAIRSGVA